MKSVQSVIFRALSFLLVGALMVAFPYNITTWLVIIIGILFLIPGMVSIATFFKAYTHKDATRVLLPVIGVGSVVLGLLLILMPDLFTKWLMYVLAAALLLVGVMGIVNILHFRKYVEIGWAYYVIPTLLCVVGLFVIFHPLEVAADTITILGIASIVYSLTELLYAIRFRKVYRQIANEGKLVESPVEPETITEAEEVTEEKTDAPDAPAEASEPTDTVTEENVTATVDVQTTEDNGSIDFSQDSPQED